MEKIRKNGLVVMLIFGLIVEASNMQSLFYEFSKLYRPDWYSLFNHATAGFASAFLLTGICVFGVRGNSFASWGLALVTMVISLFVYRKVASFSLESFSLTHAHLVILVVSVVLPGFVAYCTHQIASDNKTPTRKPIDIDLENMFPGLDRTTLMRRLIEIEAGQNKKNTISINQEIEKESEPKKEKATNGHVFPKPFTWHS